jgi:hypothetical protein
MHNRPLCDGHHTSRSDASASATTLRLSHLYNAVKQELADRSAQTTEAEGKKTVREVAREIGEFMRENETPLH